MKTEPTRTTRALPLASAVAVIAVIGALAAPAAEGALRHFDGQVLSKHSASHTFRIKSQSGMRVRFRVNGATDFERIAGGFSGLHRGLHVEVNANRTDRGLLAKLVERHRSGGGGGGGGDGGPGHH